MIRFVALANLLHFIEIQKVHLTSSSFIIIPSHYSAKHFSFSLRATARQCSINLIKNQKTIRNYFVHNYFVFVEKFE